MSPLIASSPILLQVSYTKQQQKQKQKQKSKDQDADTMQAFDRRHQLTLTAEMDDYFAYTQARRSMARHGIA